MAEDLADLQEGRVPRSKDKDNEGRAQVRSNEQPRPTQAVTATQRFAALRAPSSPSRSERNVRRQVASWEYAMFVVLAAGVSAMGFALFKPTPPLPLVRDALQAPAKTNTPSHSGADAEATQNSSKRTLVPGSPSSADNKASPAKPVPDVELASNNPAPASAATLVSSNTQIPNSPSITPLAARQLATLHIRVEHRFAAAEVLVWVDDKLSYKESMDGTVKRRMRMFKTVEGYKSGSVQLASGEHRIRVRVQSVDTSYDRTGTITAVMPDEGERQLKIDCTNRKQIQLAIE
jgi:hypothetical protein